MECACHVNDSEKTQTPIVEGCNTSAYFTL